MSTKSMIHQAKLNEWATRFADQKASGLSVAQWCKENNLSQYKYFYWKRQLKDEVTLQALPDIVPLAMPASPVIPEVPTPRSSELASATCASCASCASLPSNSCARVLINGMTIEIDSSASEAFIRALIKAVRHA
jgi:hypothetical protein